MTGSKREAVLEEARRLAVDVLFSEKAHYAAAARWRVWNYALGIPATILSVAAGASILSDLDLALASGLMALAAATLTALNTFLNPSERASQHQKTGVAYGRLRRRLRQFVQVEHVACGDDEILSATLTSLTEEVGALQGDALPIPEHARRKAAAAVRSGSADYEEGELLTAAGPRAGSRLEPTKS